MQWRNVKLPEPILAWWQETALPFLMAKKQLFEQFLPPAPNGGRGRSRLASRRMTEEQRKLWMARWVRFGAFAGLACVILGIVAFFALFAWYARVLPKPGEAVRRSGFSTKIVDRNGELLYDLYDQQRRTPVSIDQVPEHVKQATIAVEDKDFYKHKGFDTLTIIRIPYNYIFRRQVVGGSTLTQQLVKNVFLSNERSLPRKFKELVLSLQLERTFSKDQILEMYLNETPYGGTAYGVGAASELYFNKPVSEVSVTEGAILAGLPQRPSAYSPYAGKTDDDGQLLWQLRTRGVLRRMHEDGYLTDIAYEQSLGELDTIEFSAASSQFQAPHFVFYVRDRLGEMFGEDVVETAGFTVTTSLDFELQQKAQEVVVEEIEKVEDLNITNGAVMVMNPQTGEILAMVGSKDYNDSEIDGQFNVAVDGLRQPGSSIKPVTFLTLMRQGYTPASMLADVPTTFAADENQDPYEPKNYDGTFRGPVNLRNSLGSSLNIPAVKALAIVGVDQFLEQAHSMGFVTLEPTTENMKRFGLAVTLGGAEVHMIDTTAAYSSFANGGTKVEPVSILKVTDKDGKTVFEHRAVQGPRVMSEGEAYMINDILSDDFARAFAFGTNSQLNVSPNVAVKTGTTNDQRDNWAVGWSQDILVTAWVGNSDNSPMTRVASGVSGATPIWRRIILAALEKEDFNAEPWERPEEIEEAEVDRISGYPAHDDFEKRVDIAIAGTLPALPDPIHTKLKLCKGENKLATDARIAANDYEEKEFIVMREEDPVSTDGVNRWQAGIDAWISGQDDQRYKVPTEYCGDQEDIYVRLRRPEDKKSYKENKIEIEVRSDSGDGIEKIEIYVDGDRKYTINDNEYKDEIELSTGRHEIYAKVYAKSGKSKKSDTARIGVGGADWEEPESTPTPKPSASPSPSPSPSPANGGNGGIIPGVTD